MKRVLVCGDAIRDHYYFGRVLRLCPEAPVPIVRWESAPEARPGGASLVAEQLKEIIGVDNVLEAYGSLSHKHRYYADGHMLLRADHDSVSRAPEYFESQIEMMMGLRDIEVVIVSDYGKGACSIALAEKIIAGAGDKKVFVDAKNSWEWYKGAFCAFPNRYEGLGSNKRLEVSGLFEHVVRKNQQHGCIVDGDAIPPFRTGELRDPTGAGDVFLAAFVGAYLKTEDLKAAAKFANMVAGISVKYVGTHIVRKKEMPVPPAPVLPKAPDRKSSDAMAVADGEGSIN